MPFVWLNKKSSVEVRFPVSLSLTSTALLLIIMASIKIDSFLPCIRLEYPLVGVARLLRSNGPRQTPPRLKLTRQIAINDRSSASPPFESKFQKLELCTMFMSGKSAKTLKNPANEQKTLKETTSEIKPQSGTEIT